MVLTAVLILLFSAGVANASGIAAKVNDEIITAYDLDGRVSVVLATSGRDADDALERGSMRRKVVEVMIEESLKRQEAARQGVSAPEEEVAAAVSAIEKRNGQPSGSLREFFRIRGIPFSAFEASLRADIGWVLAIRKMFGDGARPSPDDLASYMEKNPKVNSEEAFRRMVSERLEQRAYLHLKDLRRKAVVEYGK